MARLALKPYKVSSLSATSEVANVLPGEMFIDNSTGVVYCKRSDGSVNGFSLAPAVNSIGTPGGLGFGVGICPRLPTGMFPMDGTFDPSSENYGNYIWGADGSIMVWIPKFYYRWGNASAAKYATYASITLELADTTVYATTAAANTAGFVLHRAFINAGAEVDGFFIDKYKTSLTGSSAAPVLSSIKAGVVFAPVDTTIVGVSVPSGSPMALYPHVSGNHLTGFSFIKNRGANFSCQTAFQAGAMRYLSIYHAQNSSSSAYNAWYDAAGTKNFPKGCYAVSAVTTCSDDATLTWSNVSGYTFAGACTFPPAGVNSNPSKTSHNGQLSGIMDAAGIAYEVSIGVTRSNYIGNVTMFRGGVSVQPLETRTITNGAYYFSEATDVKTLTYGRADVATDFMNIGRGWQYFTTATVTLSGSSFPATTKSFTAANLTINHALTQPSLKSVSTFQNVSTEVTRMYESMLIPCGTFTNSSTVYALGYTPTLYAGFTSPTASNLVGTDSVMYNSVYSKTGVQSAQDVTQLIPSSAASCNTYDASTATAAVGLHGCVSVANAFGGYYGYRMHETITTNVNMPVYSFRLALYL